MNRIYAILAATALLAVGCQKGTSDGLRLVAEGFGQGSKAAVDGNNAYWVAGETVRINGTDYTIALDGDDATVSGVPLSGTYRALYPASLNSSADLTSDNVTVTLPASYTWAVDAEGRQLLDLPMVARANSSTLAFRHITAALTVEITNHYGFAVQVDNVTVASSSDGTQYQLCGSREITLNDNTLTVDANRSDSNTQVQVAFGGEAKLTITPGNMARVQVPVLPVGEGNKFSVSVTVHKVGDAAVTKTYTRTQGTGGELPRRMMAHAGMTVGFTFSVASNKSVIFSPGNLQFHAANKWRFAEHQYDCVGTGNDNISNTYNGWIDLFGWAASGKAPQGEYSTDPWTTIATNSSYGPSISSGSFADGWDWGQNLIESYPSGFWHTVSDWTHLLNTRNASKVNGVDNARYVKATVVSVPGLIIFPDSYTHPADAATITAASINSITANYSLAITSAQWALMEAAGAIFLPAAGYRQKTTTSNIGLYGNYWSSTVNEDHADQANTLRVVDNDLQLAAAKPRYLGHSVRLVHDIN